MEKRPFENRFNNLDSKEYLKFQKSWFIYKDKNTLLSENFRFFTKSKPDNIPNILYYGPDVSIAQEICEIENCNLVNIDDIEPDDVIQFALFDLLDVVGNSTDLTIVKDTVVAACMKISSLANSIENKRFISILIPNFERDHVFYPLAWELAKNISAVYELKDEKLGCISSSNSSKMPYFHTAGNTFYSLYFRSDRDTIRKHYEFVSYFEDIRLHDTQRVFKSISQWNIIKPKARSKTEQLHPAKYPEELVDMFVKHFTNELDVVFDPMSGTGSTQVASLSNKRNAYGTELSQLFSEIAQERCEKTVHPDQIEMSFMHRDLSMLKYKIYQADARDIDNLDIPPIDYVITSPPYWDMLNMKGAENQLKRKERGLQLNYSDDDCDLGNISDYEKFIDELVDIYKRIVTKMKKGSYMTIVVKNIKKSGSNYPFAWDLSSKLSPYLILLPEIFWLQDDLSIAPYGYGNTWVSNTFHQYCLNFQVR